MSPAEIWREYDAMEARLAAPLTRRMIDLAGLKQGTRVLDFATGRGEPAIPAAHVVGPSGRVVGVDPSGPMLEMARERAGREGLSNLELRTQDAASIDVRGFDVVLARWGLMYMDQPVAALAAAARALVPGGVIVAAVWGAPERVPYFSLPRQVLAKLSPVPPIDFDKPGTFFYADPKRLAHDLELVGFQIEQSEEIEVDVMEAQTGVELVAWTRAFGMSRLLEGLPLAIQLAWETELALRAPCRLGGVTRVVVARRG